MVTIEEREIEPLSGIVIAESGLNEWVVREREKERKRENREGGDEVVNGLSRI